MIMGLISHVVIAHLILDIYQRPWLMLPTDAPRSIPRIRERVTATSRKAY